MSTGNGDRFVLDLVKRSEKPALLLLNKIDKLEERSALLPLMDWYREQYEWREIIPISALKDEMTDVLLDSCLRHLPEADARALLDRIARTLAARKLRW